MSWDYAYFKWLWVWFWFWLWDCFWFWYSNLRFKKLRNISRVPKGISKKLRNIAKHLKHTLRYSRNIPQFFRNTLWYFENIAKHLGKSIRLLRHTFLSTVYLYSGTLSRGANKESWNERGFWVPALLFLPLPFGQTLDPCPPGVASYEYIWFRIENDTNHNAI
jgi:hypothetical protein